MRSPREPVERDAAALAQREQVVGRAVAVAALHERGARAEARDERAGGGLDALVAWRRRSP